MIPSLDVITGGERITVSQSEFKSAHRLPEQANWWGPMGIREGYAYGYPALTPNVLSDWNTTYRSLMYYDTGFKNYSVEATWDGNYLVSSFPIACMNPNASELCYTMYVEHALGGLVLWELGRNPMPWPGEIVGIQTKLWSHTEFTPVTTRLDVIDNVLYVYVDDVLEMTQPVTANLQDSGIVGMTADYYHAATHKTSVAMSSFKVTELAD
jgi:hypothetical protein